jgi:hypothetical protein
MKSIRLENLVWEMLLATSKKRRTKPEILIRFLIEREYTKV